MPSIVLRGQVYNTSIGRFRSRLDRVEGKGLEEAGLQRLDVYLDGTALYLGLEHPGRDPATVLKEHTSLRPWRDALGEHTTILRDMEVMDDVMDLGELPAHPQFVKLVAKRNQEGKLLPRLRQLHEDDLGTLGISGLRGWVRDEEVVLEVGTEPGDVSWLEEPVDAWSGASMRALLSATTDMLPGSRGHRILSRVADTAHAAGLPESV